MPSTRVKVGREKEQGQAFTLNPADSSNPCQYGPCPFTLSHPLPSQPRRALPIVVPLIGNKLRATSPTRERATPKTHCAPPLGSPGSIRPRVTSTKTSEHSRQSSQPLPRPTSPSSQCRGTGAKPSADSAKLRKQWIKPPQGFGITSAHWAQSPEGFSQTAQGFPKTPRGFAKPPSVSPIMEKPLTLEITQSSTKDRPFTII